MHGQRCSATKWHSRKEQHEKRMQQTMRRLDLHPRHKLELQLAAPMRKRCTTVYNGYKETRERERERKIV